MAKIVDSPEYSITEEKKTAIIDHYRYMVSQGLIYKAKPADIIIENNLKKVREDCNKFSTND